jgi:hypothetical protein
MDLDPDLWHLVMDPDPDPQLHTMDFWIRIWIHIWIWIQILLQILLRIQDLQDAYRKQLFEDIYIILQR